MQWMYNLKQKKKVKYLEKMIKTTLKISKKNIQQKM